MMKAALAIFLMAALLAGFVRLAPVAVRAACSATGGVRERIAAVQKACRAEFPGRYFFVDLNGLYARCTGRRLCNNVRRLDGGMLVRAKVGETLDPARCAAGVADIAGEHAARGARVVYVQLPGKPDGGAERLREGGGLAQFVDELVAGTPPAQHDRVVERPPGGRCAVGAGVVCDETP